MSTRTKRIAELRRELGQLEHEQAIDRNDVEQMTFGLYDGCTDDAAVEVLAQKGNEAGRQLIRDLLLNLQRWETAYQQAGASDTAARESMAINIARALGLRGYADQP